MNTTIVGTTSDVTPSGPTQVEITTPVNITPTGTAQVEITSPVSINLGSDVINIREVKCEKRDVYMLNLAAELYKAMNHENIQSAKDNATKAIKYAMTFWNSACGWYADELADDGKKKGKYRFSAVDRP